MQEKMLKIARQEDSMRLYSQSDTAHRLATFSCANTLLCYILHYATGYIR